MAFLEREVLYVFLIGVSFLGFFDDIHGKM